MHFHTSFSHRFCIDFCIHISWRRKQIAFLQTKHASKIILKKLWKFRPVQDEKKKHFQKLNIIYSVIEYMKTNVSTCISYVHSSLMHNFIVIYGHFIRIMKWMINCRLPNSLFLKHFFPIECHYIIGIQRVNQSNNHQISIKFHFEKNRQSIASKLKVV